MPFLHPRLILESLFPPYLELFLLNIKACLFIKQKSKKFYIFGIRIIATVKYTCTWGSFSHYLIYRRRRSRSRKMNHLNSCVLVVAIYVKFAIQCTRLLKCLTRLYRKSPGINYGGMMVSSSSGQLNWRIGCVQRKTELRLGFL